MAMVISPRSKIVTLSLLIGIITVVALIITGVIGIWHRSEKTSNNSAGTKVVSSKLQQITGYAAMQHVSSTTKTAPRARARDRLSIEAEEENTAAATCDVTSGNIGNFSFFPSARLRIVEAILRLENSPGRISSPITRTAMSRYLGVCIKKGKFMLIKFRRNMNLNWQLPRGQSR
ncbi:hypothetical protein EAI_10162 [Harpegnathos saltator]|uniref:Uncharacterized protein n=1 Tax=Harpegnathos saltator TaxID=610380 RepID=E2B551_HARSA|nr:hypothetical protein EAI_10162 [Harpegnathos saltator]